MAGETRGKQSTHAVADRASYTAILQASAQAKGKWPEGKNPKALDLALDLLWEFEHGSEAQDQSHKPSST